MRLPTIFTVGYEDAHLHDFLDTLLGAGVRLVVDTRERAQSRRQGYSKTALTAALGEQGLPGGPVRLPLVDATEDQRAVLRRDLAAGLVRGFAA